MNKIKLVQKYRFSLCVILAIIGIIALLIGCFIIQSVQVLSVILSSIGTTFLSSSITIYLIKYDITEMIQKNNIHNYGIIAIVNGRNAVFQDELVQTSLRRNSWDDFLTSSKNANIDIVGISMYSFLYSENRLGELLQLALEGHKIRIVFSNPDSEEVKFQSIAEKKPDILKQHILLQRSRLQELFSKYGLEDKKKIKENLSVFYSNILPRAFIVRSNEYMIITPYLLEGPFKEPTLVVKNEKDGSYFKRYMKYIIDLIDMSNRFDFEIEGGNDCDK